MEIFYFLFQESMYFFIPLLVVALAGMFSERSGVVNIALEGTMIIGAFAGLIVINLTKGSGHPQWVLILALLSSGFMGMLLSLLLAYAAISHNSNQIITGTALNIFALALVVFLARSLFGIQQITFVNEFRIEKISGLGDIPILGPLLFQNTYMTTFLGILIFVLSYIILFKTKFGLRLRSCGEHPQAAASVGINVYRVRYSAVLISGFLAGIGGLIFVIPTSTSFNASVSGYGFLAIAVLIFGQWNPGRIFLAALFFAVLKMIASAYSGIPFLSTLPISNDIYKMIPYVATLVALAVASKNSQAPKAAGQAYNVGKR